MNESEITYADELFFNSEFAYMCNPDDVEFFAETGTMHYYDEETGITVVVNIENGDVYLAEDGANGE